MIMKMGRFSKKKENNKNKLFKKRSCNIKNKIQSRSLNDSTGKKKKQSYIILAR